MAQVTNLQEIWNTVFPPPADARAEPADDDQIELFLDSPTKAFFDDLLASEDEVVVNIDCCYDYPEFANDIYKSLKEHEGKGLPYLEGLQKNISTGIREKLIDSTVEACETFGLSPETLHLTINYMDRYISINTIDPDRLPLILGACLLIAIKYEEELVWTGMEMVLSLTGYVYSKAEIIEMEEVVLSSLEFELEPSIAHRFLERFLNAAQVTKDVQSWGMLFGFLANFIMELSLYDCDMFFNSPSLIAAATIFLAKYIINPITPPWTATLKCYTEYKACDLKHCVAHLYFLLGWNREDIIAPEVRNKYSQRKYDFAALVDFPPPVPDDYFL